MKKYFVCIDRNVDQCYPITEGFETLGDAIRSKLKESIPKDGKGYFDLTIFKSEDGKRFEELSFEEEVLWDKIEEDLFDHEKEY